MLHWGITEGALNVISQHPKSSNWVKLPWISRMFKSLQRLFPFEIKAMCLKWCPWLPTMAPVSASRITIMTGLKRAVLGFYLVLTAKLFLWDRLKVWLQLLVQHILYRIPGSPWPHVKVFSDKMPNTHSSAISCPTTISPQGLIIYVKKSIILNFFKGPDKNTFCSNV